MAEYKWERKTEGIVKIKSTPERKPSLANPLLEIKYYIKDEDTKIELRRYAEALFGEYSNRGVYTIRKYNTGFQGDGWRDLEITGEQLRKNMNTLLRLVEEYGVAGNFFPHPDFSRNFWANGDLELLEEILKRETALPSTVKEMLADLAGVEYRGTRKG